MPQQNLKLDPSEQIPSPIDLDSIFAGSAVMTQYCFTIVDGSGPPFCDYMELPDNEAARSMALRTSSEAINDLDFTTWDYANDWAMHLTDERGRMVLSLRFSATTSVQN